MNAKLSEDTVKRIEDNVETPISRGMDKAINICLDELEELKENGKPKVLTCNRMEELANAE